MTLSEFLLARIAEDEAVFRAAGPQWSEIGGYMLPGFTEQRALADCEAKRQIVERHTDGHRCDWGDWYQPGECETRVLRILAGVYADHSEYDADWAACRLP